MLKYFDQNQPTKVSVDASKVGLGAVLLQLHRDDWHPVAYTSRAMSKNERNYLQIKKEMLAVVYGSDQLTNMFTEDVTSLSQIRSHFKASSSEI